MCWSCYRVNPCLRGGTEGAEGSRVTAAGTAGSHSLRDNNINIVLKEKIMIVHGHIFRTKLINILLGRALEKCFVTPTSNNKIK